MSEEKISTTRMQQRRNTGITEVPRVVGQLRAEYRARSRSPRGEERRAEKDTETRWVRMPNVVISKGNAGY